MVSKFFVDRESYSIEDGRIYGDMGYTFCDMGDTMCDELRDAVRAAAEALSEDTEMWIEDGEVPIHIIWEYLFNDDDEYFYLSDAVDKRARVALVGKCEYSQEVVKAWEKKKLCPIKVIDLV